VAGVIVLGRHVLHKAGQFCCRMIGGGGNQNRPSSTVARPPSAFQGFPLRYSLLILFEGHDKREGISDSVKWPNVDVTRTWVDDGRGMREVGRGEYPPTAGSPPPSCDRLCGLPRNVLLKEAYYGLDQVLVLRKSRIDMRHSLQAPPAT